MFLILLVIAGESMGVKSEIRTLTPTYYLDFTVDPGAEFSQPITVGWTTFAYTLEGNLKFGKYINGLKNKD
jgi:redox-sensitive bicupin YhaK (pirin superfamily)